MRNSPGKVSVTAMVTLILAPCSRVSRPTFSMTSSCVMDDPLDSSKYSCKNSVNQEQCLLQTAPDTSVIPLALVDDVSGLELGCH